jgi:uncharacterized membrane protein
MKKFAIGALGLVFFVVGIGHFVASETLVEMIPASWPAREAAVIITGAVEMLLAIGLLIPRLRSIAAMGILTLLVIYFPIHVIDLMREQPVIGPKWVAIVRLPIQGVMIYLAWILVKDKK